VYEDWRLCRLCAGALIALTAVTAGAENRVDEDGAAFEPHSTLGVFIGDTTEDRRDGITLGAEYEYRFSEPFGIGVTAEHVSGDFDTNVIALPIALHRDRWKLYAGPGMEFADGDEEPLFRIGVEYGFHFGGLEVSPQVDVDFVDGEQLFVWGIVFAFEL